MSVNINDLLARAAALRDETALNSISPDRAGGIMYDTLLAMNELWLQQGSALVISKIYASVAAMEADSAPVSDLTGQPLRPGQIVVIASSDSDNGSVYRYDGTEDDTSSWSEVGAIGGVPVVDSLDSDSSTLPLAARQGKVLDEKISEQAENIEDNYTPLEQFQQLARNVAGKHVYDDGRPEFSIIDSSGNVVAKISGSGVNSFAFNVLDANGNIIGSFDRLNAASFVAVLEKILPSVETSKLCITDPNGYIGMLYDGNGLDVAKISAHFRTLLGNDAANISSADGIYTITDLADEFRCAFKFKINADVNKEASAISLIDFDGTKASLVPAAVTLLDKYFSSELGQDVTTPQQQPKFNSGFSILGNTNVREQLKYRPLVGLPMMWLWYKGDFAPSAVPTAEALDTRSQSFADKTNYAVSITNDRFAILNGSTEVWGTSLKSGDEYKTLSALFDEITEGIGEDFAIKRCDVDYRKDCGDLLQFGTIKLVGNYYQEYVNAGSKDYHLDSFPIPIYLKQDETIHTCEILRRGGYLYISIDGICYRAANASTSPLVLGASGISIFDVLACNRTDDVDVIQTPDNDWHLVSEYSQALIGVQVHFTEDYNEADKVLYTGVAEEDLTVGSTLYIKSPAFSKKVASISAAVTTGDTIAIDINTSEVVNITTGNLLGTAVNGSGAPALSMTADNGIYYQTSVSRVVDALKLFKDNGYVFINARELKQYLSGDRLVSQRTAFILKTDSNNGGGVFASLANNRNREIYDRMGIDYIIGSIIENEISQNGAENYARLVSAANANDKNVISHSLTHDTQLENKCSMLAYWELLKNVEYALTYGLQTNLYSWPGSNCQSENIYSMLSIAGFIGSISNRKGYNVLATQPMDLCRNDIADRTSWGAVEGYVIKN